MALKFYLPEEGHEKAVGLLEAAAGYREERTQRSAVAATSALTECAFSWKQVCTQIHVCLLYPYPG